MAHEPLLRVSERLRGDAVVVTAIGEVDLATGSEFAVALDDALGSGARRVVVDLLAVTFMGSVGLAALVQAARQAQRRGLPRPIVVAADVVLRPIRIAALDRILTICGSLSEALAD